MDTFEAFYVALEFPVDRGSDALVLGGVRSAGTSEVLHDLDGYDPNTEVVFEGRTHFWAEIDGERGLFRLSEDGTLDFVAALGALPVARRGGGGAFEAKAVTLDDALFIMLQDGLHRIDADGAVTQIVEADFRTGSGRLVAAEEFVFAAHSDGSTTTLWQVEADGRVEALLAQPGRNPDLASVGEVTLLQVDGLGEAGTLDSITVDGEIERLALPGPFGSVPPEPLDVTGTGETLFVNSSDGVWSFAEGTFENEIPSSLLPSNSVLEIAEVGDRLYTADTSTLYRLEDLDGEVRLLEIDEPFDDGAFTDSPDLSPIGETLYYRKQIFLDGVGQVNNGLHRVDANDAVSVIADAAGLPLAGVLSVFPAPPLGAPEPTLVEDGGVVDDGDAVPIGITAQGEIETPEATDTVSVTLEEGQGYIFDVAALTPPPAPEEDGAPGPGDVVASIEDAPPFDPILRLFDQDGNLIAEDDDSAGNLGPRIFFTAPEGGGVFFLEIGSYLGETAGRYQITTAFGAPPPVPEELPDRVASDLSSAVFLQPNNGTEGMLEIGEDKDVFATELTGGQTYRVALTGSTADGAAPIPDAFLRILDAEGETLVSDDDGGPGLDAQILFTAPESGTFFIEAASFVGELGGSAGAYTLTISDDLKIDAPSLPETAEAPVRVLGDATDEVLRDGNPGTTTIDGGQGNDRLVGFEGNDTILGGEGDDTIIDRIGDNFVFGEAGADRITTGAGNDSIDGGTGVDVVKSDLGDDRVALGAGDDIALTGGGDDTVSGGTGADVIKTSDGADEVDGGDDPDVVLSGAGDDIVLGGAGDDVVKASTGDDTVELGDGDDFVFGFRGQDTLFGGAGNDTLRAEIGNDLIEGGAGDDRIVAGPGFDTIRFREGFGEDRILDFRLSSDTLDFTEHGSVRSRDDLDLVVVGQNVVIDDGAGGRIVLAGTLGNPDWGPETGFFDLDDITMLFSEAPVAPVAPPVVAVDPPITDRRFVFQPDDPFLDNFEKDGRFGEA